MEKGQKADGKEMKAFLFFFLHGCFLLSFSSAAPDIYGEGESQFFPLLLLPLRENEEAPFSYFALLFRSFRRASQAETRVSD